MRIGVFGDSFAASRVECGSQIWWRHLARLGHDVTCHGAPGSSLDYSAKIIYAQGAQYDFVIWCATTPGRFSVKVNDTWVHTSGNIRTGLAQEQAIGEAVETYKKYLFDWSTANLYGKAIIAYLQNQIPNMMIVPSFPPPIYTDQDPIGFNLFHLSERETLHYFPTKSFADVMDQYHDLRPAHLTPQNNKILAELIAAKLEPGIFTADYQAFVTPDDDVNTVFEKK